MFNEFDHFEFNFDKSLLVFNKNSRYGSDIMFAGAAFRKVFATFVLLHTLLNCKEDKKILLLDQPEALLYHSVKHIFIEKLFEYCKDKVQIIVATTSHWITTLVPHHVSNFSMAKLT